MFVFEDNLEAKERKNSKLLTLQIKKKGESFDSPFSYAPSKNNINRTSHKDSPSYNMAPRSAYLSHPAHRYALPHEEAHDLSC